MLRLVHGRLTECRLPKKIDDERLKKLWGLKISDYDLAERMGHMRGALHRRARKLGLGYRRNIWARENV